MIDIYQPHDVPRWKRRLAQYRAPRRNILYTGDGTGFSKMSTFVNYDANTRVSVIARPPIGAGSGPQSCCCCECIQAPGGGAGPVCKFGTTPAAITLIASGISQPSTCFTHFTGSAQASPPSANGTFTPLDHPPPAGGTTFCCDWGLNNPGPITGGSVTLYTDGSCSVGAVTHTLEGSGWSVGYEYVSGVYYRGITFESTDGTSGENFLSFANWTAITPEIDCSATVTVSNQLTYGAFFTSPGGGGNYAIGSGGSVTISPA